MANQSKLIGSRQKQEMSGPRRTVKPVEPAPVPTMSPKDLLMLQRALENPSVASPQIILTLQRLVGNRAVSGLIQAKRLAGPVGETEVAMPVQRMELGEAKSPKPAKTWMSTGGFDSKHVLKSTLTPDAAKARYEERFNKERARGRRKNTVVAEEDLKTALKAGNVSGDYPGARTGQRNPVVVQVSGYTVSGSSNAAGKQMAGTPQAVSQIGVEGSATGSIYFPDHLVGELSG